MSQNLDNRKIAKNTIVLYIRMMVMMCISLYTSRVILNTLGVNDYGVYNVVGGFVAMFTLVTGALSNAISRYITFELGRDDKARLQMVFSNALLIQILLAFIVIILSEIVGLWFLNTRMQIPEGRLMAANWVLQCSILTFVVNLINIPYQACIVAHEKMTAFAYISILESVFKLCIVISLYFVLGDKLIVYSLLLLGVAILIRLINGVYCNSRFEECHFSPKADRNLLKEMTALASWNFMGTGAFVLSKHGVNLLINVFFGVVFNAARGIATQVDGAINQFVSSFTTAMNPQITKLYAAGNMSDMFKLVFRGTKYAYFLMLLVACPVIVEAPLILKIWLNVVPDYTVLFVRLTLIQSLITTLSTSLFVVAMATGDIRRYQLCVGSLGLSTFIITYVCYLMGCPVQYAYYISILIQTLILFARLIVLHNLVGLDIVAYFKEVIGKVILVTVSTCIILYLMPNYVDDSVLSFIINIILCLFITALFSLILGLEKSERLLVFKIIYKIKNKL